MSEPKLSVFLCHSSQDKPIVRELYQHLLNENWIDPWLDEEKLLPGQDWDLEIEKAVEAADVVIVCLSSHSVSKEGYVQRELKFILDIALEKPEGTIFVIPLRLDECAVPRRLRSWQYVDYFPRDQRKRAHQRLVQSLQGRYGQLVAGADAVATTHAFKSEPAAAAEKANPNTGKTDRSAVAIPATTPGMVDLIGSILPVFFFMQLAPFLFGNNGKTAWWLLAVTAVVFGGFLILRRQVPTNQWAKFGTILFIVTHSVLTYAEHVGWPITDMAKILVGVIALVAAGLYLLNLQSPRISLNVAASLFGAFIALYGIKLLSNAFEVYPTEIQIPTAAVGFAAAMFWWLER